MTTRLGIIAVGPASSVQDGGRFGAQRYGLTPSGAMDPLALATANTLAGNGIFAAAIEIGPFAATFTATGGAVHLALAGAVRSADIGARALQAPQSFTLKDGETLKLGFARGGAFSYLAIAGGVTGEPMFGSLSVNARAGLGSPYPRPLQSGDHFDVAVASARPDQTIDLPPVSDGPIRVVLGPQDDEFSDEMKVLFLDSDWSVSATSDRMGFRLEGPAIKHLHGHNIVSDGTVLGSIQVPGNGTPIVLMPDRGTSGGYPKIATVISSDFGRFAQTPAGKTFRFKAVPMDEAQRDKRAFVALLHSLPGRVQDLRDGLFDLDQLFKANVAGVAINAIDARTWQNDSWQSDHDKNTMDGTP